MANYYALCVRLRLCYRKAPRGRVHTTNRSERVSRGRRNETRHLRDKKKKKGEVGTEKEKEKEEGERLANFFYTLHEFLAPTNVPANVSVPAELPARYKIDFVPASDVRVSASVVPAVVSTPVISNSVFAIPAPRVFPTPAVIVSSPDYSIVSSANFIPPACIEPTP